MRCCSSGGNAGMLSHFEDTTCRSRVFQGWSGGAGLPVQSVRLLHHLQACTQAPLQDPYWRASLQVRVLPTCLRWEVQHEDSHARASRGAPVQVPFLLWQLRTDSTARTPPPVGARRPYRQPVKPNHAFAAFPFKNIFFFYGFSPVETNDTSAIERLSSGSCLLILGTVDLTVVKYGVLGTKWCASSLGCYVAWTRRNCRSCGCHNDCHTKFVCLLHTDLLPFSAIFIYEQLVPPL